MGSPSTRRVWIEIRYAYGTTEGKTSPSTRRVWIEIIILLIGLKNCLVTLHTEGVDRNPAYTSTSISARVTLHTEGVDRNEEQPTVEQLTERHPPHGGCG